MELKERLSRFVEADLEIKALENQIEILKYERRKQEDAILDTFAMNSQQNALVEYDDETYRVYIRRTTALRVKNESIALAELRSAGLGAFITEVIDTGKLGSWAKKREAQDKTPWPIGEGLEYHEYYRLYAMRKRT